MLELHGAEELRGERGKGRRLKAYRFAPEILMSLGSPDVWTRVVRNGVPADARVITVIFDHRWHGFIALVESEAFEEVGECEQPPFAPEPLFTAVHRCRPSIDAEILSDEERDYLAKEWESLQWGPLAGRVELLVDGLKWSCEGDEFEAGRDPQD